LDGRDVAHDNPGELARVEMLLRRAADVVGAELRDLLAIRRVVVLREPEELRQRVGAGGLRFGREEQAGEGVELERVRRLGILCAVTGPVAGSATGGHCLNAASSFAPTSSFLKAPAAATMKREGWIQPAWNAFRSSRVMDSTDPFVAMRLIGYSGP